MSITRRAMRPNQSHIALTAIARSPYRILPLPRSICLVVHPAPTLPSPTDPACFLRGTSHLGHRSSPLLPILTHKLNAALRIPSHIIGDGSPIPRIAASSAAVYVPSAHVPHIFPACLCCIVRTACIRSVSITVFRTSCLTFGCILNIHASNVWPPRPDPGHRPCGAPITDTFQHWTAISPISVSVGEPPCLYSAGRTSRLRGAPKPRGSRAVVQ